MLHLFEAFGIELEYMIVDAQSLDVRPIADHVLRDAQGMPISDLDRDEISWSNELTYHVVEVKTNGPTSDLSPLPRLFQQNINEINRQLESAQARLLPTAMHPWMNPQREMQLWPHEYHTVYETFDKIFDCRGHGWANLQSMHINLPFANDEEFGRLHAAIRLILPLLPALAASSPCLDGRLSGKMDSRLDVYRRNAKGVASIAGRVIPEPVFDQASYDREIFQPMFRDIARFDPEGVLQNEFLNSRGAIARFSRGAIEIRVIDVQECPQADIAIAALTIAVLKLIMAETWTSYTRQRALSIDDLEPAFLSAIDQAGEGVIQNSLLLQQFGISESSALLNDVWRALYAAVCESHPEFATLYGSAIDTILNEGCLARRIVTALNGQTDTTQLRETYRQLADCLLQGEQFHA